MEFEHERKERERREKKKQEDIAYQKRDAEWRKRQQAKKPLIENRQKIAQQEALNEMSSYNFEEDQEKEEEKGWYTEGGQERKTSKYQTKSQAELKSMNLVGKGDAGKAFGGFEKAREQQMREAMRKKRNIDFNVNNYDIEELAAILKFQHIPLNEGVIQQRILRLKRKFPGQKAYQVFFDAAEKRLIENLNLYNRQTWVDQYDAGSSPAAKVLREQFQQMTKKELNEQKNQIINFEKDIIGIPKKPLDQNFALRPNTQGTKNPLNITETHRVVNFDSHYRQILDASSVACEGYVANSQRRLYTSTNYTVNLSQPLTNVTSITLENVQIPNSWYVFTPDYGTDQFTLVFKGHTVVIKIDEGDYTPAQLVWHINLKLNALKDASGVLYNMGYFDTNKNYAPAGSAAAAAGLAAGYLPFPLLEFTYNPNNNKITINNYDPDGRDASGNPIPVEFKWHDNSLDVEVCSAFRESETPQPGGKADYNLGWLMGFRQQTSIVYPSIYDTNGCRWINGSNISPTLSKTPPEGHSEQQTAIEIIDREKIYYGKTVPRSQVDVYGPKYFILTLDDFNNNKPNKDLISLVDTTIRNFKLPSYINKETMDSKYGAGKFRFYDASGVGVPGYECMDTADIGNNERACSTNSLNIDLSSNLTKAQKYTAEQIQMARIQKGVDRYTSPNSTDLLARIPVERTPQMWNKPLMYQNEDKELTKRKYFGPVKLTKFKVRLLNDKGFEVNLHDKDWSFSIIVTHMYQY